MTAVILVQARLSSTRLPRKALADIGGMPVIAHVMTRARAVGVPVILATSSDSSDDELAAVAHERGWKIARGSLDDVLARFVTALPAGTEHVVRLTGDCPLLDPAVVRAVLAALESSGADYVSNTLEPSFPDGLDCEAIRVSALLQAAREAILPSDREHVTPYIWRHPERFGLLGLRHFPDLSAERWTIDEAADLEFVRAVVARLGATAAKATMRDVLAVLGREPELRRINAGRVRNEGYARSKERDPLSGG